MSTRSKTIAISLAITLFTMQGAESAAKTSVTVKKAGRATSQTLNTILSGSGIPTKSIGIDGDLYIDIKNANLYGPKTKGAWKVATSLKTSESKNRVAPITGLAGATGAVGAVGARGATGDRGLSGATGDRGSTGSTGATGATGNPGAKGDTGLTGAAGLIGSAGTTGAQGASGVAGGKGDAGLNGTPGATGANGVAGLAGSNGVSGIAGANGTPGANGAAGVKGDTGLTGSAGISTAKFTSIAFTGNLAGIAGSTKASDSFGTFAAGKSYIVRLLINTYDANSSVFTYGLGMSLSSSGDNPVISSSYSVAYGSIYSGGNRSTVSIIADVVLNGASTTSSYSLIVTLTSGANGAASIAASGISTQILVGTIG
ncbi:MAG: collagen-like protein [Candidatus Planktophila sp.]|nr:collagen-like protein [Candidatus Planktophila sp.]